MLVKFSLFLLSLMLFTSCTQFKVETNFNEFRNTYTCEMTNNYINKHNISGNLSFNIKKDTELKSPYYLVVKTEQSRNFVSFKQDSHLRLNLTKIDGQIKQVLLKGAYADKVCRETTNYIPGCKIGDTYTSGYLTTSSEQTAFVLFRLSEEIIDEILDSTAISFELETLNETIRATFSKQNIENIQEFGKHCRLN